MNALAGLLAILATICFALAATLWQRASMSLGGISMAQPKSFVRLATSWIWLLGLVAQGLGVVFQAGALDRGRVAVIQPLLVTTIIWALPLGYFLTGQKVSWRQGEGAAVIVVGLAIFAIIGDPAGGVDSAPGSEWLAAVIVIVASCVALCLFANRGGLTVKAALLGTVAGILFGLSATLMKPVVESLHSEGWGAFGDWELWVMAIGGIVGFLVQQISLATGKLVPSVATVSVANPVVSVILGALILQERLDRNPPWHFVVAVAGLAVALLGAAIVSAAHEEGARNESTAVPAQPSLA